MLTIYNLQFYRKFWWVWQFCHFIVSHPYPLNFISNEFIQNVCEHKLRLMYVRLWWLIKLISKESTKIFVTYGEISFSFELQRNSLRVIVRCLYFTPDHVSQITWKVTGNKSKRCFDTKNPHGTKISDYII